MIRLLIVDDEKTTRESLARYIPWSAMEVGPVRIARNGLEALALAEQEPPEILLTDVRMPKMDGLALAERIRARQPGCKIIFLSGYADKEYLKKAIALRAVSYVEKPIDLEEVREAVRAAVSACRQEAGERERAETLARRAAENESLARQGVAKALVTGSVSVRELRAGFADVVPAFEPGTAFTAAAVTLRWADGCAEADRAAARRRILDACGGIQPFSLPCSLLGFVDDCTLALVVARTLGSAAAKGRAICHGLRDRLQAVAGQACAVAMGVGRAVAGLEEIPRSYEAALGAARLSFYCAEGGVFFAEETEQGSFIVSAETCARFQDHLRLGDMMQAERMLEEVAAEAAGKRSADVQSVREAFSRMALMALQEARSDGPLPREIREAPRLCDLVSRVRTLLEKGAGAPAAGSARMREVQSYVRGNFADVNLSLQSIAERAGLSRTYLCSLFKTDTGTNLYEYVTQLRIDKAKDLLRGTGLTTHEVALRVGYQDASYFSALFRKRVGVSPSGYRKT